MTLKKVEYGFIEEKVFTGADNKKVILAFVDSHQRDFGLGYNLTGFQCSNCGFIFSKEYEKCEFCKA